jgi:hypothetical protein
MKKSLLIRAAAIGLLVGGPAQAATIVACGGNNVANCVAPPDVNLDTASNVKAGTGTTSGGAGVAFSSTEFINLVGGAAQITAVDGALNNLMFGLLAPFSFLQASFNLQLQGGSGTITIDALDTTNSTVGTTHTAIGPGQNTFLVSAGMNELLRSVTISSSTGFDRFEQLRIAGVSSPSGVPEPATWAMMLVGFGILGTSMRRKGRTSVGARVRFA